MTKKHKNETGISKRRRALSYTKSLMFQKKFYSNEDHRFADDGIETNWKMIALPRKARFNEILTKEQDC